MGDYKHKYLKYKTKYNYLKIINKIGGESNDNTILYENLVGDINPYDNTIVNLSLSDHYLLQKLIKLRNEQTINIYNINISQQFKFKTKISNGLFFNLMRNKENLDFMHTNKKNILNTIVNISNNNLSLLKNNNEKKIKKLFIKELNKFNINNINNLKIIIESISFEEAKKFITENFILDTETNNYYVFNVEFNEETICMYRDRISRVLKLLYTDIENKIIFNSFDYLIINIQELCPLNEIIDIFENFIQQININLRLNLNMFFNQNNPIIENDTYSLSIVSSNTNYNINYVDDSIMSYIIEKKKNLPNKNIKLVSEHDFLPIVYNFHTGLFDYDDLEKLIIASDKMNNFLISGDLNIKLVNNDEINCIKQYSCDKNITINLNATPESNYPVNNYTYDVFIYKIF